MTPRRLEIAGSSRRERSGSLFSRVAYPLFWYRQDEVVLAVCSGVDGTIWVHLDREAYWLLKTTDSDYCRACGERGYYWEADVRNCFSNGLVDPVPSLLCLNFWKNQFLSFTSWHMTGRERCSVHGKNKIKTKATQINDVNICCQRKWRKGRMKLK